MFSAITGLMGMGGNTPAKSPLATSPYGKQSIGDPTPADLERSLRILTSVDSSVEHVISEIRRIAELVIFAEQKGSQVVLDMFFEKNVIGLLRDLAIKRDAPTDVQIQVLQTLSILAQSLRKETNLFHFLSQNHINTVISHEFAFETAPEELLAHYVTLLKTVSLRLNRHLCQFFYDSRDSSKFPLYDKAVQFFNNNEPLVRAAARSVILMVHRVDDREVDEYIHRRLDFFVTMCDFIRTRFIKLEEYIALNEFEVNWLNKVEAGLSDALDDYSFLQDVLSLRGERKSNVKKLETERSQRRMSQGDKHSASTPKAPTVSEHEENDNDSKEMNEFERVIIERIMNPLLDRADNPINVLGLAQCCLALKSSHIVQHIHSRTFGLRLLPSSGTRRSLFQEFAAEDERLALSATTLAFFLVDRIPVGNDPAFVSRRKSLNDASGMSDSNNKRDRIESVSSLRSEGQTQEITVGEEDSGKKTEELSTRSSQDEAAAEKHDDQSSTERQDQQQQSNEVEVGSNSSSKDESGSSPTEQEPVNAKSSPQRLRAASSTLYPNDLAQFLLQELVHRTQMTLPCQRPVLLRLLAKLLVHVTFDSRLLDSGDVFLSPDHSGLLREAMSNAAMRLKQIAEKKSFDPALFIESFENEWRDLKSGPLKVSSLVTNPSSVLPNPELLFARSQDEEPNTSHLEEEQQQQVHRLKNLLQDRIPLHQRNPLHRVEEVRALANIFMVLRLCWASLEQAPDIYLPSVGNADVDSIRENSAIDLRRCEFLEVQAIISSGPSGTASVSTTKLLLVLVAGAMLLVEPDNERRTTGVCRSVSPIHRIEIGSDVRDPSLLHFCIRSHRRIGLTVRVGQSSKMSPQQNEWSLSLKFESQPKALFARDHIERAAERARSDKFKRIQAMLDECCTGTADVVHGGEEKEE